MPMPERARRERRGGVAAALALLATGAAPAASWRTFPAPAAMPSGGRPGWVSGRDGPVWYQQYGRGRCVTLLHPGMADSGWWSNQVPALRRAGFHVLLVDARGHGHTPLGREPLSYEAMAQDVVRVLDAAGERRCAVVGWSDGAIVGLVLAMRVPARVSRVFAFGANMTLAGVNTAGDASATFRRYGSLTAARYRRIAPTPAGYSTLERAVQQMWRTQPDYSTVQLATIAVPVAIADGVHDEVIRPAHTRYLARTIAGARLVLLPRVSHFAPLQAPAAFNDAMLRFLVGPGTRTG